MEMLHMGNKKPAPDWERIEVEFRAGVLSLREIALANGISHVAVAKRAQKAGVPVVLIAGSKGPGWDSLAGSGVTAVVTLEEEGIGLQQALNDPEGMLARATVVACRRHPWTLRTS